MELTLSGADAPIDVHFDRQGIAHVYAATVADAYRGMGYAEGYERLWQIHLSTLYALGEVSAVLGERFVTQDLMHRVFRVPAYDMPESPGDWIVDAYLEGLNLYVDSLEDVPPEFVRAGASPRRFTRRDVASRYRFTGWFQHKGWLEKIYLGKLMARHGVDWFRDFVPSFTEEDAACITELGEAIGQIDSRLPNLLFPLAGVGARTETSGSNNWAVTGSLSASGAPMMAMDPHQPHTIPNTFFYVHLHAGDWDAFGASFPGVPYFMMGFNRHLAWGLTTGFIDTYDVYVERGDGFETESHAIEVKGEAAREYEAALSKRGPILESLTDALGVTEHRSRTYVTALDWVMRDLPTAAGALARLPLAESCEEFGEALFENDVCPLVNNIICVDRNHDLRRFIAATVPKRVGVSGVVPLPGWQPEYVFERSRAPELLVEHNPQSGYALTANNDTMGDRGPYPIHNFPAGSARADRIRDMLAGKGSGFTVADFERMQLDLLDLKAKADVPELLKYLTDDAPEVVRAAELLAAWDCRASTDSKAATLYYRLNDRLWSVAFMREVLGDELLRSMPLVAPGLARFSMADHMQPGSPWADHAPVLSRILCSQVSTLVRKLDEEFGDDWSWGRVHQVGFAHTLAKHEPWTHLRVGPDPLGGSGNTLGMAMHMIVEQGSEKVTVYHGPAFRWVVDLSDPLHFRFVIAGGNGGRADSAFTTDHYAKWRDGEYFDTSLVLEELAITETIRIDKATA